LYWRLDTIKDKGDLSKTHIPHSDRASIHHSTPANVLVPLKDVKYEGIWIWFLVHPTTNVDPGGWIWLAVNGED